MTKENCEGYSIEIDFYDISKKVLIPVVILMYEMISLIQPPATDYCFSSIQPN